MNERPREDEFTDIALNPKFQRQEAMLLRALLQSSDYGVLVSGLDREDIIANRRLGELFHVLPDQVVHSSPDEVRALALSRARDPQAFEEVLRRAYDDPNLAFEDEIELLGEPPRILRRFTAPLHDRDNNLIGRLWTFLDISETRRLQSEVREQLAARTQDFAETADILRRLRALCALTLQPRSFEELLGEILQQIRGLGGTDSAALLLEDDAGQMLQGMACAPGEAPAPLRLSPQAASALAAALLEARRQGAGSGGEASAEEDGDNAGVVPVLPVAQEDPLAQIMRCHSLAIAPLRGNGVLRGLLALGMRGASESRHLSAVADQIALTLQTHRLQADLRAALDTLRETQQRMVEMEKLRTAGTLAVSVAHDIRNIVTALQMEFEMAVPPAVAPEVWKDQLNRFSTLTHRLLAFARPRVLDIRPINLGDTLRRVAALVEGQAAINDAAVTCEVPADLPLVLADAAQLEHLLVNLCINGIQAMTPGGGMLRLRARREDDGVAVEVTDTGCGMAPDVRERIFEPFFTTRVTGTGLGLFSCRRIVEEHGGHLSIASEPGQGTTFTIHLRAVGALD